jgi:hypothetical protein
VGVRAGRRSTITSIGVMAAAMFWITAAPALAAPHVRAPSRVSVGKVVELSVTGFRPGASVAVQLTPTANLGGNCCGIIAASHRRVSASGGATLRFTWPSTYLRGAGTGSSARVAWKRGEHVTISVYVEHDLRISASASTVVTRPTTPSPLPDLGPAPAAGGPIDWPDLPADALEQRFRPQLYFDSSEPWRPLAIPYFFATDKPRLCPAAAGTACPRVSSPAQLAAQRVAGHLDIAGDLDDRSSHRSPEPACRQGGRSDCDAPPQAGMYVHRVQQGGYAYLDYWVFYRFNHAPFHQIVYDEHEGDWEGLTVAIPASDPDPQTFDFVAFAAHAGVYRYLRDALDCGAIDKGACDEASPQVNAYVANGTHATYPRACGSLLCQHQTGVPLPEYRFDGAARWGANPWASSLREFPRAASSWTYWPGNWNSGDIQVSSPGRQRRFNSPADTTCSARFSSATILTCLLIDSAARAAATADDACASWLGPFVAATACDPTALKTALQTGSLGQPGTLKLSAPGTSTASASGIAQALGAPLGPGDELTVSGPTSHASDLLVRSQSDSEVLTARFDDITLTTPTGSRAPAVRVRSYRRTPPRVRIIRARRRGPYVYVTVLGSTRSAYLQLQRGRAGGVVVQRTIATRPDRSVTVRVAAPRARYVQVTALSDAGRPSRAVLARVKGHAR